MGILTGKKGRIFVLGSFAGFTKSKVLRLIEEDADGKTCEDYTKSSLTRVIVSPALWAQIGTQSCSLILKAVMQANVANATDDDPLENRVWILPLDWLTSSIKAGKVLKESKYDLELMAQKVKRERAKELREEKKEWGGNRFESRKDRKEFMIAEEVKRFEKEQADEIRIEKQAREVEIDEFDLKYGLGRVLGGGPSKELDLTGDPKAKISVGQSKAKPTAIVKSKKNANSAAASNSLGFVVTSSTVSKRPRAVSEDSDKTDWRAEQRKDDVKKEEAMKKEEARKAALASLASIKAAKPNLTTPHASTSVLVISDDEFDEPIIPRSKQIRVIHDDEDDVDAQPHAKKRIVVRAPLTQDDDN